MRWEISNFAPPKRLAKDSVQMRQYWKAARAAHISQQEDVLGTSKRFGEENKFMKYSHAGLFIERHMKYVVEPCKDSLSLVAAFDENCLLIGLWGNAGPMARAKQLGIRLGGDWSLGHIGPNAVSVGAVEQCRTISVGEENYTIPLQAYAIYFAPILQCEVNPPFEAKFRGGIAVLVPKELENPDYQMVASSTAMNVLKGAHHYMRLYRRYRMMPQGLLTVDSLNGTKPVISSMDQPLFDMLGIPEADYRQRPVRELIDGYPKNSRFWSIIEGLEEVTDLELTLSLSGRKVDCIVTTDPYFQPVLQVKGVHFFITTPQWIAQDVSEKIGNSAVRTFDAIVGKSPAIKSAINRARLMANTESNIIILGESGVGKDVFAQAIHNSGPRRNKPFLAVNCGALSRDLIASELFGYESGAFTGAKKQGNIGKFELANGGTLFLDEIGELPMDMQAMLLRAVEQKKIARLGGGREIDVDVRVISATNANLPDMIANKLFREDLYYRLSTFELHLPPLRERDGDPVVLAEFFVQRACARYNRTAPIRISDESKALLADMPWRGNVRELQNLMEGIVQLYPDEVIQPSHIFDNIRVISAVSSPVESSGSFLPGKIVRTGQGRSANLSRQEIVRALEQCGGNRSEAAQLLGIARRTLYRYLEKYQLTDV